MGLRFTVPSYKEMMAASTNLSFDSVYTLGPDGSVRLRWHWRLEHWLRALACRVRGHDLVTKRYREIGGKNYEVHEGCTRCMHFRVVSQHFCGIRAMAAAIADGEKK